MVVGVEIPIHEAVIFDLSGASADGFWSSIRPVYFSLDSSLLSAS